MGMPKFQIDGVTYSMACSISRKAEIKSSDLSGDLLDGDYYNDVIGTYMQYDVQIAVPRGREAEYASLYEVLTNPVGEHTVTLPYNQSTITFKCKIDTVSDKLYREEGTTRVWRGTTFSCTATEPSKRADGMAGGGSTTSTVDSNASYTPPSVVIDED